MIDTIVHLLHFDRFGWRSAVDILILTIIVYQILRIFQGTRAVRMLWGIMVLVVAYILTMPGRILELATVNRILGALLLFTPLAVVVLFQNHIRRMLAIFGTNPLAGLTRTPAAEKMIDEIVLAATTLASKRHGALIVLEREQGLRSFAETGNPIDAIVSYDLLTTIFMPNTPLHDGAVIIADGRIKAASCFLPLPTGARLGREYGSRHRAALGITDETDAVAVVVSEQTGSISLAREGRIRRGLDPRELTSALTEILTPPSARRRLQWWRSDRGSVSGFAGPAEPRVPSSDGGAPTIHDSTVRAGGGPDASPHFIQRPADTGDAENEGATGVDEPGKVVR